MKKIISKLLLLPILSAIVLCGCDTKEDTTVKEKYYTLGQTNPFGEVELQTLVSESDKEDVYFQNGSYYVVEDGVIKQTQSSSVIPRDITLLDYLKTYEDFSQEKAVIQCTGMDGSAYSVDLSTPWEQCSFGEFIAYWETSSSNGILVTLYPDSLATVNKFLYYTDLTELMESVSVES